MHASSQTSLPMRTSQFTAPGRNLKHDQPESHGPRGQDQGETIRILAKINKTGDIGITALGILNNAVARYGFFQARDEILGWAKGVVSMALKVPAGFPAMGPLPSSELYMPGYFASVTQPLEKGVRTYAAVASASSLASGPSRTTPFFKHKIGRPCRPPPCTEREAPTSGLILCKHLAVLQRSLKHTTCLDNSKNGGH